MSDKGGNHVYSLSNPSLDTLIVEETSIEDVHPMTSTSSNTSSTTIYWIPGGFFGRLLQALGPSIVGLVIRFKIKKRLSSISSDINIRLRNKETLSEDETDHFGAAYHVLVDLSSGSYSATVKSQALKLRLTVLRAIILSECSCLSSYWHKYTIRKTLADLNNLASGPHDSEIRETAGDLIRLLVTKVADELSSLRTHLRANDLGTFLAGTNIVSLLCHDLAYGTGGYSVQSALDRISCSSWGESQLRTLNRHSDIVLDAARRLLTDFDNVFSKGMAYRIFGEIAAEHKTRKLGRLLSGPHGVESLVARFNYLIQPSVHSYHGRFGVQCMRSMEALCTALLSACRHGFTQQVVDQGLCQPLITLVEIFVERDKKVQTYVEDLETEDPDVERDQIAVCKLILKVLQNDGAKNAMLECGATEAIRQFGSSFNRQLSDWYLRVLIDAITQKLH